MAVTGLVAGSLIMGSLPVLAGTTSPRIDKREGYQQGWIYQGVDSGQLTRRELNRLENRQTRIKAAEARMKADGRYTRRERARTHKILNQSSRNVYRAQHNNRVR
jgi:hypothetical protein